MSDPPSQPAALASALVIPFPVRSMPLVSRPQASPHDAAESGSRAMAKPRVATSGLTPEQRLTRALASLNTALAEQRVAVAEWRDGLVALKTTTARLADSLHRYRVNLDKLNNSVSALRDNAHSLETWADGVTAKAD
jgi:septal ring factor EnvC (AmiA/AmiB activator)